MTNKKIDQIAKDLKDRISEKYHLTEMRIFGSSARGDRTSDSDIDIWIHLPQVSRQIEEDIFDMAYDMELKYDCLIDIIVTNDCDLADGKRTAPIYEKIRAEGSVV